MIARVGIVIVMMPIVCGMAVTGLVKVNVSLAAFVRYLPVSVRMGQRRRLASDVRTDEQDGKATSEHKPHSEGHFSSLLARALTRNVRRESGNQIQNVRTFVNLGISRPLP